MKCAMITITTYSIHPLSMRVKIGQECIVMSAPYDHVRAIVPDVQQGEVPHLLANISVAKRMRSVLEVWRIIQRRSITSNPYFASLSVNELANCWLFIPVLFPSEKKSVYRLYFDAIYPHKNHPRIKEILTNELLLLPFLAARSHEAIVQAERIDIQQQEPGLQYRPRTIFWTSAMLIGAVIGFLIVLFALLGISDALRS